MSTYSESHWRNIAAPIIRRVLSDHAGQDEKSIRAALLAAYPFGRREYHPYKIWCDEIARQRGRKPPLGNQRKWRKDARERAARTEFDGVLPGMEP